MKRNNMRIRCIISRYIVVFWLCFFTVANIYSYASEESYGREYIYLSMQDAEYSGEGDSVVLRLTLDNNSSQRIPICELVFVLPYDDSTTGFTLTTAGTPIWSSTGVSSESSISDRSVHISVYDIPARTSYSLQVPCSIDMPESEDEVKYEELVQASLHAYDPANPEWGTSSQEELPVVFYMPAKEAETTSETPLIEATESDATRQLSIYGEDTATRDSMSVGESRQIFQGERELDSYIDNTPVYITRYVLIEEKTRGIWPVLMGVALGVIALLLIIKHIRRYKKEHERTFTRP